MTLALVLLLLATLTLMWWDARRRAWQQYRWFEDEVRRLDAERALCDEGRQR